MMKSIIVICVLVAASNAFSIDAMKKVLLAELEEQPKEVTLREHLDSLESPDPAFRAMEGRQALDCSAACTAFGTPTVPVGTTCDSNLWVPQYQMGTVEGCECLSTYKCCPAVCPVPTDEERNACWANGQEGSQYGVPEVDCCGCQTIRCLPCDPPLPRNVVCPMDRPESCSIYNPQGYPAPNTHCWEANCTVLPPPERPEANCDATCQSTVIQRDNCYNPYTACVGTRMLDACPYRLPNSKPLLLPSTCYAEPVQQIDLENGNYYDVATSTCLPCQKWKRERLSCDEKNAMTAAADCHQVGNMGFDRRCMNKRIIPDVCQCNDYICEFVVQEQEVTIPDEETCPNGHVRASGISVCGARRDICHRCPELIPTALIPCPHGVVVLDQDCMGCPLNRCLPPTFASQEPCESNSFVLNGNQLECIPASRICPEVPVPDPAPEEVPM